MVRDDQPKDRGDGWGHSQTHESPRPVELRDPRLSARAEALMHEAITAGEAERSALLARRMAKVPPEFVAQIERGGLWGMAQRDDWPTGFARPRQVGTLRWWKRVLDARLDDALNHLLGRPCSESREQ